MFAPTLFRWPWARPPTLRRETDRIGRIGAKVTPGTAYFYTNAGYNALGGLVETVSDQPLGLFLRDEVYRKLGMRDSYTLEVANTPSATELRSAMMEIVSRAADSSSDSPRRIGVRAETSRGQTVR
jgi:CubicO group peptidase (beta-lactamase class C family)